MKKPVLFLLISAAALSAQSQDKTLETSQPEVLKKGEVLVIPNSSTMFRCDDDRELAQANKATVPQVRAFFREKVAEEVWLAVKEHKSVILLHPSDPQASRDLQYIYMSTGYHAEPVKRTEATTEKNNLEKFFSAATTRESDEGTKIARGEVRSAPQMEEKAMRTTITNNNLLPSLGESYGTSLFVFIGEIDVLRAPGTSQHDIASNRYQKELRVHYTIMDSKQQVIDSGISSCTFPSTVTRLSAIQSKCMQTVGDQISSALKNREQ